MNWNRKVLQGPLSILFHLHCDAFGKSLGFSIPPQPEICPFERGPLSRSSPVRRLPRLCCSVREVDAPLDWDTDGPNVLGDVLDQKTFKKSQVPSNSDQYGPIFARCRVSAPSPQNPGENTCLSRRDSLDSSRAAPRVPSS